MLGFLKFLIVIILAALGAAFAVANSAAVQIDLGLYRPTAPLSVLLLSLGVGLILGGLASSVYYLRFKRENIALKRQRKIVEQQQASSAPRLSNQ